MTKKMKELWGELKSVLSGSTFDALLPPLLFVAVNALLGLGWASISAILLAVLMGLRRLVRKQPWLYALAGLVAVVLASGLAWLTRNAKSYFLPGLAGSALLLLVIIVSLVLDKPMVAWISHLTRKWPLAWFWREDVKPAYREATWIWAVLFFLRLVLQVYLFQRGEVATLAWANALLGWPVTILVLVISYLYGMWRLHRLGGPGVQEFMAGSEPPWQGQRRGF
jgi:hypothetical protein